MVDLEEVPRQVYAYWAVDIAIKVLFYRATTQIDKLLSYSSQDIQDRWQMLGPSVTPAAQITNQFFEDVDFALQPSKDDTSIGHYIRSCHFGQELTEDQKEVINSDSVLFCAHSEELIQALVPFSNQKNYAVKLDWNQRRWVYADCVVLDGKGRQLFFSIEEAIENLHKQQSGELDDDDDDDDDDDYWNQFPKPSPPKEKPKPVSSYWDRYDNGESEEEKEVEIPPPVAASTSLIRGSIINSLTGAAKAAQAIDMPEAEFLQLALSAIRQKS